jgi:hypothetical protein
MKSDPIIKWLLSGDVSIQYQVQRDLLELDNLSLRNRIADEGWGADFLSRRSKNGHWGRKFYQPKWISTHYTILDLKNLNISPNNELIRQSLGIILKNEKGNDGGILPIGTEQKCDVCLNGMLLNYSSYFEVAQEDLKSIVDFILSQQMNDGGFNCQANRKGARHSSLHSTLSVAEGINEYVKGGYTYRVQELISNEKECQEFMLQHRLFRSDHTGNIIDKRMLMLSYPSRWKYDILRALDYFRAAENAYDPRMDDAMEILINKRRRDGCWPLQAKHPGQVHFDMEKAGEPSRWNTLRVLRVFKKYPPDKFTQFL